MAPRKRVVALSLPSPCHPFHISSSYRPSSATYSAPSNIEYSRRTRLHTIEVFFISSCKYTGNWVLDNLFLKAQICTYSEDAEV